LAINDGSRSKFFYPSWVRSICCCSGWVSHFWFEFGIVNFTLKSQIFQFFSLWVKKNLIRLVQKVLRSKVGRLLIYCRSKVCTGQVESKSVQVKGGSASYFLRVKSMLGSGQGPSLMPMYSQTNMERAKYYWILLLSLFQGFGVVFNVN